MIIDQDFEKLKKEKMFTRCDLQLNQNFNRLNKGVVALKIGDFKLCDSRNYL